MMSATTKNGVRITERGKDNGHTGVMSLDVVKLLKTQDAGYLQTILQQTRRERERVQKEVILARTGVDSSLAPAKALNKKKTFDDEGADVEEAKEQEVDADDFAFSDSEAESSDDEEAEKGLTKEQIKDRRRKRHARDVLEGRLDALTNRERDLSVALMNLSKQRAKMNHTVGGVNKAGVKFKVRERKR